MGYIYISWNSGFLCIKHRFTFDTGHQLPPKLAIFQSPAREIFWLWRSTYHLMVLCSWPVCQLSFGKAHWHSQQTTLLPPPHHLDSQ